MWRWVTAAVLMGAAMTAPAGDTSDSRKNCKIAWPGNGGMQQACHNNNMAARRELRKLERDHWQVVQECQQLNPGALAGVDYSAAMYCVRHALKAQRRQ